MNKLITFASALVVSSSAIAHQGDHAANSMLSALNHIFSSSEHAVAGLLSLTLVSVALFLVKPKLDGTKLKRAD